MKKKPTKKEQPITLDKLARMVEHGFEAARASRRSRRRLSLSRSRAALPCEDPRIPPMNTKLDRIERTLPTKLQRRIKAIEEALNL